jgi:hypothetical protein
MTFAQQGRPIQGYDSPGPVSRRNTDLVVPQITRVLDYVRDRLGHRFHRTDGRGGRGSP